jgi:hypothetical protein
LTIKNDTMDESPISTPEEKLTQLLRTAQRNIVNVRSFMRVMGIGLKLAGPEIYPAMEESMRSIVASDAPESLVTAATESAVETRLSDAATTAEAAILLFSHSVLDAGTTELCEIIAEVAPELWEEALHDRKIRLKDLKEHGSYSATLRSLLHSHMSEVERKSLIERIRIITQKCFPGSQPLPTFESIWGGEFRLDLKRIEEIDKRRQDVIHRAEFTNRSEDFEDDLEYCELTLTYLVKIVSFRFRLQLGDGMYEPGVEKLTVTETLIGNAQS